MIDCGKVTPEDYEERLNKLRKELETLRNKSWSAYFERKLNKFCAWVESLEQSDDSKDHALLITTVLTLAMLAVSIAAVIIVLTKCLILLIPTAYVFYKIYQNIKD